MNPQIAWPICISAILTTPNCLEIKEVLSDGKTEFKYYARGIGCVKEVESDAQFVLVSHQASSSSP